MDAVYILKRPRVTEKSTFAMNEGHRYCFEVDPTATKAQIKQAVEQLYKVRVVKVNTQVHKGKNRRLRYGWTSESNFKTAMVRIHQDDTIDLF